MFSSSAFGGGNNEKENNKVHSKPVTLRTQQRRRKKRIVLFSFTFIVVIYILYNFLRKQTLSEARRIIGTGRKARTDLEGQVLVEEAIKTGKIGREER